MEMLYSLRELDTIDIKSVQEIERAIFPTLWPRTPFKKELKNKMAKYLVAYAIEDTQNKIFPISNKIAPTILNKLWSGFSIIFQQINQYGYKSQTLNPNIVGLVGTWYMTDEAHITTIGVLSGYRQKGIGELLLIGCIEQALANQSRVVTLEVRVSNIEAQTLYKKYGFENVGLRKRYYSDNNEDALIMTTNPINKKAYQTKFHKLIEKHEKNWGKSIRIT
mgnify:CR=1 FL=1